MIQSLAWILFALPLLKAEEITWDTHVFTEITALLKVSENGNPLNCQVTYDQCWWNDVDLAKTECAKWAACGGLSCSSDGECWARAAPGSSADLETKIGRTSYVRTYSACFDKRPHVCEANKARCESAAKVQIACRETCGLCTNAPPTNKPTFPGGCEGETFDGICCPLDKLLVDGEGFATGCCGADYTSVENKCCPNHRFAEIDSTVQEGYEKQCCKPGFVASEAKTACEPIPEVHIKECKDNFVDDATRNANTNRWKYENEVACAGTCAKMCGMELECTGWTYFIARQSCIMYKTSANLMPESDPCCKSGLPCRA